MTVLAVMFRCHDTYSVQCSVRKSILFCFMAHDQKMTHFISMNELHTLSGLQLLMTGYRQFYF